MPREVRYSTRFVQCLEEDFQGLAERNRVEWFQLLEADILELEALMATAPRLGKRVHRRGGRELRRLPLNRTPYVVWYAVDDGDDGAVTLLRLAHVRQRGARRIRW